MSVNNEEVDPVYRELVEEVLVFCQSENLSENGLREIINTHGRTTNNNPSDRTQADVYVAACENELVSEGIIQCLVEYFPAVNWGAAPGGETPFHAACMNRHISPNVIRLLLQAAPDSVGNVHPHTGLTPLHCLCDGDLNENAAIEILRLLLEQHPASARHSCNDGYIPLHYAARKRSPEFCRIIIDDGYPGSERLRNNDDCLPLHLACFNFNLPTIEYLYNLYPDAVNARTNQDSCAIHHVILSSESIQHLDVVRFLLDCDPNVRLQETGGVSLLCLACIREYNDSNIDVGIKIIEAIYDANPESIGERIVQLGFGRMHHRVQVFLYRELLHVVQSRNSILMATPDEDGQLPLHCSLRDNVRLGSIKLLVTANRDALRHADNKGALPLHVASEHHDSPRVIQYLLSLDPTTLDSLDRGGNTALHYACQGAKYRTIALLLEKYQCASVSKANANKKLPINLLWESSEVIDRDSMDYMDSVFCLLKAYPMFFK